MRYFALAIFALSVFLGNLAEAHEVSLRYKIGQMLIVGFNGKTVDDNSPIMTSIEEDNIGGVILFDYNAQTKSFDKNIESPSQVKKLNNDLQNFTQKINKTQHHKQLPLLIAVDYEGGLVNRLHERYGFPTTTSAANMAQKSLEDARPLVQRMAETLKENGFNLNFAPVLDVNVNPDNPIIGKRERSFSNHPEVVSKYATLYSDEFLTHGIQCAYKHFPGHGSSTADSHLGFVDVTSTWGPDELYPYELLLHEPQHCGMIMTAHIVNRQLDESGLPATLSHKILTGILRDNLQFNGVIITDDMQMKAISDHYGTSEALTLAINAGADMFIFGNQLTEQTQSPKQLIDMIEAKVNSGEITKNRIDEAYAHITAFKTSIKHEQDLLHK